MYKQGIKLLVDSQGEGGGDIGSPEDPRNLQSWLSSWAVEIIPKSTECVWLWLLKFI